MHKDWRVVRLIVGLSPAELLCCPIHIPYQVQQDLRRIRNIEIGPGRTLYLHDLPPRPRMMIVR